MNANEENFIYLYKIFSFIVWNGKKSYSKYELIAIVKAMYDKGDATTLVEDFIAKELFVRKLVSKYVLSEEGYKFWQYLDELALHLDRLKLYKHMWTTEVTSKSFILGEEFYNSEN